MDNHKTVSSRCLRQLNSGTADVVALCTDARALAAPQQCISA
ncbi:hypothetical protein P3T16_006398 [Paraburkholderia sp. GAS42]|jgi:hypothetical protein